MPAGLHFLFLPLLLASLKLAKNGQGNPEHHLQNPSVSLGFGPGIYTAEQCRAGVTQVMVAVMVIVRTVVIVVMKVLVRMWW